MAEPEPVAWAAALADRRAKREPFGWYRRMHDGGGIRYDDEREFWDVSAYEAVTSVLADAETFSSVAVAGDDRSGLPSMLNADPPEHTALREPVEEFFQPGAVRELAPGIRETTRSLLDDAEAEGDGRIDVVNDLEWPLPIHTIAALLGVPAEAREQFKAWSDAVVAGP
jgi:cytochrome P450